MVSIPARLQAPGSRRIVLSYVLDWIVIMYVASTFFADAFAHLYAQSHSGGRWRHNVHPSKPKTLFISRSGDQLSLCRQRESFRRHTLRHLSRRPSCPHRLDLHTSRPLTEVLIPIVPVASLATQDLGMERRLAGPRSQHDRHCFPCQWPEAASRQATA